MGPTSGASPFLERAGAQDPAASSVGGGEKLECSLQASARYTSESSYLGSRSLMGLTRTRNNRNDHAPLPSRG
jgi:hypothetical protein